MEEREDGGRFGVDGGQLLLLLMMMINNNSE